MFQISLNILIAQKDIPFSNFKIEAFNKIIKHKFLFQINIKNWKQLLFHLPNDVETYNDIRPQFLLQGNIPNETHAGKSIDINIYKTHFDQQKVARIVKNHRNKCNSCKV